MSIRPSCDRFLRNIRCIEIGVGSGSNAMEMLQAMPRALFWFVDSYNIENPTFQENGRKYSEEEREGFIANIKEKLNDGRATLIIEDSAIASLRFPDKYFDYIYIDAEHDYDSVRRDIRSWYPKLKVGGLIGGHDVGVGGVRHAITEFFGNDWISEKEDWYTVKK
jgi:predicted O-methyltransferase YrrM